MLRTLAVKPKLALDCALDYRVSREAMSESVKPAMVCVGKIHVSLMKREKNGPWLRCSRFADLHGLVIFIFMIFRSSRRARRGAGQHQRRGSVEKSTPGMRVRPIMTPGMQVRPIVTPGMGTVIRHAEVPEADVPAADVAAGQGRTAGGSWLRPRQAASRVFSSAGEVYKKQ